MIEFMKGHELFDTAWQVLSNIGYLSGRLGITISRIEFLPGDIDNLRHNVNHNIPALSGWIKEPTKQLFAWIRSVSVGL